MNDEVSNAQNDVEALVNLQLEMMDYVMKLNCRDLHLTMEHENESMELECHYWTLGEYCILAKHESMLEMKIMKYLRIRNANQLQ